MFNFIAEKLTQKKKEILDKINLEFKGLDAKKLWKEKEIKEGEKASIAACDGSFNYKEFRGFTIYVVTSEALIFDGKLKSIKACDIDILKPYKFTRERLRFYMHILETKTLLKALKHADIALFDGSIIGDIIRPLPFRLNPSSEIKKEIKEEFLPKLEISNGIEVSSKRFFKEIEERFEERAEAQSYLEYLEHMLCMKELLKNRDKIVAIAKTSQATEYFKENIPDIAIFEKSTYKQGYSIPIHGSIDEKLKRSFPILNDFFRDVQFTIFYARLEDRRNVLKFEIPKRISNVESLLEKIKGISVEGYPYLLKKAHKDVLVSNKEIEKIVKAFGFVERTGREML
jgi:NurA-like 5'-3' nuclease